MNCANLIGRIARDIDLRATQSNQYVATFVIAIDRPTKDKTTDYISIVAWGKTAEFVSKYFKKGTRIGITGRIQTRNYDDKDGKKVYVTEVIAEEVYFADGKAEKNPFQAQPTAEQSEELPF